MGINYELLRAFVAAGAARTFAEAAAARRVSVSAISQQVKALEAQLGAPLFERVGRRARLTAAGAALLAALREEFARIDDALERAAGDVNEPRGAVALGAPRTFGRFWLRPRLARLLRAHPGLAVAVEFGVPSLLERRLSEGFLDLAILVRPPELRGVEAAPLHTETFVAVASPGYIERRGAPEALPEFQAHDYIIFDRDLAMHAPWWRASFGPKAQLPGRVICEIASLEEMLALSEAGLGIAVLPDYHVAEAVSAGRVVVLSPKRGQSPKQRPARNTLFLAWRRGAVDSARLRAARAALERREAD